MPPVSSRTLHVANGSCTTGLLAEAGVPGRASIWADPLHEGPVPSGLSDDELLIARADYIGNGSPSAVRQDIRDELLGWWAVIADDRSYDELVLWFEHDLFDQLNLIHLLSRVWSDGPRAKPISLICIGSFPGHANFKGLGELTPSEIGSLVETRQLVNTAQFELAARAWQAFRAPDPRGIELLIKDDTPSLPFLRAALRRHLQEFPWTRDGLSKSERRLLELAAPGSIEIRTAFPRMHDGEDAFYITDGSFWQVALDLDRASLVAVDIRSHASDPLPEGAISLTSLGRDVLSGREDRIARCGIDRWLGGVHLSGSDRVWRWDDDGGKVV